jgi:hypothetical protein
MVKLTPATPVDSNPSGWEAALPDVPVNQQLKTTPRPALWAEVPDEQWTGAGKSLIG